MFANGKFRHIRTTEGQLARFILDFVSESSRMPWHGEPRLGDRGTGKALAFKFVDPLDA